MRAALKSYWESLGGSRLPTLPPHPVDALVTVLAKKPLRAAPWEVGPIPEADPWPVMALGTAAVDKRFTDLREAAVHWAFSVGELTPVARKTGGGWLVVDRVPNAQGDHFAFEVGADGVPAGLRFDRLAPLTEYLAALAARAAKPGARVDAGVPTATQLQAAALGPDLVHSGFGALPLLVRLAPSAFFAAHKSQRWLDATVSVPPFEPGRTPHRTAALWALVNFLRTRKFTPPPGLPKSELPPAVGTLFERLVELEKALAADEVPEYIAWMAFDDDPAQARHAQAWMKAFDAQRKSPADAAPADDGGEEGRRFRAAYAAVESVVAGLEDEDAIELVPQRRAELIDELMRALFDARAHEQAVKRMTAVLLESECVEEVFADDLTIQRAFRAGLGA
jgi:hypothetical protein